MDVLILLQGMPPVPGLPVTGNGLRAHALASGLEARGHRVRLVTRSVDVPSGAGSKTARAVLSYDDPGAIPELVAASGAEAVVVCHWELVERLPDPCPIPVVADLYGPRLVEAQFEQASLDREGARFVEQLRRADAFLVSSERQRWFALPWLMLAGFDCRTLPVHVVPISADPRPPLRFQRKPVADPTIVTGGVFWPWRASERPLERLLATLDREGLGHVQLYGGSYPLATEAPVPYRDPRERLGSHPRLSFHGLVPYDHLFERYAHAQLAFDVMEPNAERELSFSFRVVDYLAASLPVITNRFTEIAASIESAEAGWCVDLAEDDSLERVLTAILRDPAEVARRGHNARRLVEARYSWDRTIEPLDRYLRAPARAARGSSVLGTLVQVAGEAFRAREDRLREIERSRGAVRRAETLDAELAALHREQAERATELNLLRAELEARTRDVASLKDQAAAARREQLAQAAQLESERDRIVREAEGLRGDRDLLRARAEEALASLRRAADEARDLRAARDQATDELQGTRALVEHRAAERDRALDAVRTRDEALARAEDERKRLAGELARGEARIHDLDRRADELREAIARREADLAKAKAAAADVERERDRLADAAQSATRERDQLAAALERGEAKAAESERRLEHTREQLVQRDSDAAHLRGLLADAERERDRVSEAAQLSSARAEEERRQLAAALERSEAKVAETDRRLEHAREQLAARELDTSRSKAAAAELQRERDRLLDEVQAIGRARDALESRAHQLEQRLDIRSAEAEDLARQVAALRGEIESRAAEVVRKHAELEAVTRERDHERSRGTMRDEEIRKLKDGIADVERDRDRALRELAETRERLDLARREAHEAAVAARGEAERLANETSGLKDALTHEREVRAAAEAATRQSQQALGIEREARGVAELAAHESQHALGREREARAAAEVAVRESQQALGVAQSSAQHLTAELARARTEAHEQQARMASEIQRLTHESDVREREVAHFRSEVAARDASIAEARAAVAVFEARITDTERELDRLRATPILGWWIRRRASARRSDDAGRAGDRPQPHARDEEESKA